MPPDFGVSTTPLRMAVLLATISLATTHGPVPEKAFTLLITSNIEPDMTYDDSMGPFVIGQDLTITCSIDHSGTLSWWEDGIQLATRDTFENGIFGSHFDVGTLQAEDSRRHFTCQDMLSGTEKSVDLFLTNDNMVIKKDGHPLKDEETVKVFTGTHFSLDCIVYGDNPSTGSWWEVQTRIPSNRTKSHNAIHTLLDLGPARSLDNGRKLTCRARNGQLTKSVVLEVVADRENDAAPSPTETSKAKTTISPSSSTTTPRQKNSSISETVPDDGGTSPKVHPEKSTATTGENESFDTSIPDGQGTPVPETVPNANSGTTTTAENSLERNEMLKYVIAGGAAITFIGLVVVILIFVRLKLCRTINKLDTSTSQQQGNSCEQRARAYSSVQNTLTSLDPQNLPPLSPLLPRPPPVEGGDETASPGGRMSAVMPDDRDHSYYYPDLINNSYYYPKITDDVKKTLLEKFDE